MTAADLEFGEASSLLREQIDQLLDDSLPQSLAALAEYQELVSQFEDAAADLFETFPGSAEQHGIVSRNVEELWARFYEAVNSAPMRQECRDHAACWWRLIRPGEKTDETVEIFGVDHRYHFGHSFELLTMLTQHARWSTSSGYHAFRHVVVGPRWVRMLFSALTDYHTGAGRLYVDTDIDVYETAATLWLADTGGGAYFSFDDALYAGAALAA